MDVMIRKGTSVGLFSNKTNQIEQYPLMVIQNFEQKTLFNDKTNSQYEKWVRFRLGGGNLKTQNKL